jgi:hypothetical protein
LHRGKSQEILFPRIISVARSTRVRCVILLSLTRAAEESSVRSNVSVYMLVSSKLRTSKLQLYNEGAIHIQDRETTFEHLRQVHSLPSDSSSEVHARVRITIDDASALRLRCTSPYLTSFRLMVYRHQTSLGHTRKKRDTHWSCRHAKEVDGLSFVGWTSPKRSDWACC